MIRDIIEIDEELCVGCGNCVPNCHQGALQVIDGKVRLLSDLMCEGLGACVGHCPTGAMQVSQREAEPYDEAQVMEKMIAGGANVIRAHLEHLSQHAQHAYLAQALDILKAKGIANPMDSTESNPRPATPAQTVNIQMAAHGHHGGGGCPGSMARSLGPARPAAEGSDSGPAASGAQPSELRQWPVQLHLLNPQAPYFQSADVLLAADCTAFAMGGFHRDFLRGKTLAIACPKLDDGQDSYVAKLVQMIDGARINTLTVMIMEVPCCRGLLQLAQAAVAQAKRKVPVKLVMVSLEGAVQREEWV